MTTNQPLTDSIEALVQLVDESDQPVSAYDVIMALLHRARGGAVAATPVLDGWVQLESQAGAIVESLTGVDQESPQFGDVLHDLLRMSNDLEFNAND